MRRLPPTEPRNFRIGERDEIGRRRLPQQQLLPTVDYLGVVAAAADSAVGAAAA